VSAGQNLGEKKWGQALANMKQALAQARNSADVRAYTGLVLLKGYATPTPPMPSSIWPWQRNWTPNAGNSNTGRPRSRSSSIAEPEAALSFRRAFERRPHDLNLKIDYARNIRLSGRASEAADLLDDMRREHTT